MKKERKKIFEIQLQRDIREKINNQIKLKIKKLMAHNYQITK